MLHRLPRQGDILVGYARTEPRRVLGWACYATASKASRMNDRSTTGLAKEYSTTNNIMLLDYLNGDGVFHYNGNNKEDLMSTYSIYHHQLADELYSKLMED
jgi:hypothetical protein